MTEPRAYYAAHGMMTDPREQTELLNHLPADLRGLCGVVQGLMIPAEDAALYGVDLSKVQRKDAHIRPAADMLRLVRRLDSRPLAQPRPAGERISGGSRDFALLLSCFLRQQGRPARLRPGYVTYLGDGLVHDQWICGD